LNWYKVQNSKRSFKDYENLFNSTIIPYFKDYYLNNISAEMVENYKIKRAKEIKPATVNKELTALRHLFNKAIQWGYLVKNPLSKVKRLRVNQKKFRFLSLEKIDLVLENCSEHIRPIILTAIHTGLRRSELFRLEWADVDFNRECIVVTAKSEEHTKNYLNREIPLTNQLIECLKSLKIKNNWVFSKEDGSRYSGWMKKSLETAGKNAGIPRFTLHDLRHTFASHLVMEGVDLPTVQKLMGHSKISTTMIYAHLAPDHLKNAMYRLSSRFDNGTNED
jgi:integrase